ncbi:MAG: membrane protein insertion efficiency factor YidD [Patescibacteria group bacterium]
MKKILISTIDFYQKFLYQVFKNLFGISSSCRFETTCSNYAKQSISNFGIIKGTKMSAIRLLKCQPFYK